MDTSAAIPCPRLPRPSAPPTGGEAPPGLRGGRSFRPRLRGRRSHRAGPRLSARPAAHPGARELRAECHHPGSSPTTDSIIAEFAVEKRVVISFDDVPEHLKLAFVASEDNRFWEHYGVDPFGILRAMWDNLLAGEIVSGASTITQQVSAAPLPHPRGNRQPENQRSHPRVQDRALVHQGRDPHLLLQPPAFRGGPLRGGSRSRVLFWEEGQRAQRRGIGDARGNRAKARSLQPVREPGESPHRAGTSFSAAWKKRVSFPRRSTRTRGISRSGSGARAERKHRSVLRRRSAAIPRAQVRRDPDLSRRPAGPYDSRPGDPGGGEPLHGQRTARSRQAPGLARAERQRPARHEPLDSGVSRR